MIALIGIITLIVTIAVVSIYLTERTGRPRLAGEEGNCVASGQILTEAREAKRARRRHE